MPKMFGDCPLIDFSNCLIHGQSTRTRDTLHYLMERHSSAALKGRQWNTGFYRYLPVYQCNCFANGHPIRPAKASKNQQSIVHSYTQVKRDGYKKGNRDSNYPMTIVRLLTGSLVASYSGKRILRLSGFDRRKSSSSQFLQMSTA